MKTIKKNLQTFIVGQKERCENIKKSFKNKLKENFGGTLTMEMIIVILVIIVIVAVIVMPALNETVKLGFDAIKQKMNEIISFVG